MDLHISFFELMKRYTSDSVLTASCWQELEKGYTGVKRRYHNFSHIEAVFSALAPVQSFIRDADVVWFSVFYHDAVYAVTSGRNEERSAQLATRRLLNTALSEARVEKIGHQILATKYHLYSDDADTNYFLDADLSVLGTDPDSYLDYTRKIRTEYRLYPDMIYKPGRKKVLEHFLNLESIYKTRYFADRYEEQARLNIQQELQAL